MNTKEKIFDITKFEQLEENNGILEGGYSASDAGAGWEDWILPVIYVAKELLDATKNDTPTTATPDTPANSCTVTNNCNGGNCASGCGCN